MNWKTLKVDTADHIAHVILNRPDKRNAMNSDFWREIREIFTEINKDHTLRAVVISSTGPHFTAGLDLMQFSGLLMQSGGGCDGRRREALRRFILDLQESFSVIDRCPVPVLAAIQGACIGGGIDMVSACDMRYCTEDAYFVIKEIDLGITADVGTLQRLPHVMPQPLVRELAYTGRKMPAAEALDRALVNRVFADQQTMLSEVMEVARCIAKKSPLAIRGTKEMLNYARDHSINDGLRYVATWNAGLLLSNDVVEAVMAAQQKRSGNFDDLDEGVDFG